MDEHNIDFLRYADETQFHIMELLFLMTSVHFNESLTSIYGLDIFLKLHLEKRKDHSNWSE